MLMKQNQQNTKIDYKVSITKVGLQVQVALAYQKGETQLYVGIVPSIMGQQKLQKYGTLQKLKEHIQNENNIQIDLQNDKIYILQKIGTRREKYIIILQIPLIKKLITQQQIQRKEHIELKKKVEKLEQQNVQLRDLIKKMDEKFQMMEFQTIILRKNYATNTQIDTLIKKHTNTGVALQNLQKQVSKISKDHLWIKQQIISVHNKAQQWANQEGYCYKTFRFYGNRIICIKQGSIFGKVDLREQKRFTVQIKRLKRFMSLGLIDNAYTKELDLSVLSNKIIYRSSQEFYDYEQRSWKYDQGEGYKCGDRVNIIVDYDTGKISWNVGTRIVFETLRLRLKDKKIQWVPFIYLNDQNDEVAIV